MIESLNRKKSNMNEFPLHQLLQSAGIQTWTWHTLHGQIIFHASGAKSARAYHSLAEFVNSIHADDREQVQKTLQDSVESKDEGEIMYRLLENDQPKWIQARWVVNRNVENDSAVVSGINIEISVIPNHDQFLKTKDSAYQDLTDSIQDLLFVFDEELRYLYWNKASENFIGISSDQIIGKHLFDIFPDTPEIRASERIYIEVLKTKKHRSFESQFIQGEKKYWFDVNVYPSSNGLIVIAKDITDKKKEENALLGMYKLQEEFFSQSLLGIFFMMLDEPVYWDNSVNKDQVLEYVFTHQRVTMANNAMLVQYRASSEQYLGLTPADFFSHNMSYGKEVWKEFFDKGWLRIDTDERKFDGTPMWIEGDYKCLYDDQGRITGHFGIQMEITERKRTEKELQDQKERFQSVLTSIPIYVVMIDPNGKMILVNEALQKEIGWTEEEWLTENILEKCYPDPVEYDKVLDFIHEADGHWSESKTHTKYGEVLDTEWANFRLSDGTTIGIGRNITERKHALCLLQESETKFSTLFNQAPYPMVLSKSPDYQFVNVNDAWLDLFGFAREEVIGKTSSALKVNPDEKTRAQIANTLQKNKTVRNVELVLYTKNGDRLVTLLNIDLLRIGNEDYVLNAMQNITQQKLFENTLRHSEELFKAITTHSPDHIIIQDQNLVYEYVLNPQLGLTVQEMVGKSDLELLSEHEATELIAIKSRVMRDKQHFAFNIPLINLSGQTEYFEGTYVPRLDQNGEVDGLFGYFRNVTKQIKVEQELKRSIDDLNIMYQISKELSQLYPLEILNNKIIELLDQYSYYEYAAILLIDHETKKLLPFAVSDKSKGPEYTVQELENIRKLELNIHKGITGWVVRNNKSYRCGNVQIEPQYIEIHPEINSEICVPLQIGQKVMGVLLIETERMNAYHEEDQSLLESIATHISIAIENARLLEELKQTSENLEKKVAQRTAQLKETLIQKSADEERQRLARELHDTVSQSMFSISLISESLPRLLSHNSALFWEGLDDLTRLSRGALAEMRSLLFELRPAAIQNIRLNELLHLMLNGLMSQTRLKVVLNLAGNHVIPENVRYVLFRITKEALNNIIKHANASTVTVNRQDIIPISGKRGVAKLSGLKLSIKDDGVGFNPKVIPGGLHGLAIMKERAKSIGATLSIRSKPEEGTEIIIFWRGEFLKELTNDHTSVNCR